MVNLVVQDLQIWIRIQIWIHFFTEDIQDPDPFSTGKIQDPDPFFYLRDPGSGSIFLQERSRIRIHFSSGEIQDPDPFSTGKIQDPESFFYRRDSGSGFASKLDCF